MSKSTSSTEVSDVSREMSSEAGGNDAPEDNSLKPETTIAPGPTNPEANNDSLTHDYVHVDLDEVSAVDSEEIQNSSKQQSGIASYLEYLPSIGIATIPLSNYLPGWLYPPTETDSGTNANTEIKENNKNFEIWLSETITGTYSGSIEEENRFRACLIEAISGHFNGIQRIDDGFLTESCPVTKEEMYYARASESQCARRILLMLLHRDTKTILYFLFGLINIAKDLVENIVRSLHQHLESGFMKHFQCIRCILKERVSICLISDHLPRCDSGLLTFVNIVSEEDQPAKPSVSERLWNNLFQSASNEVLYEKVIRIIISALESCGYQADVARMLKEDIDTGRNSFICRCEEMRSGDIHESQEHQDPLLMSTETEASRNSTHKPDFVEKAIDGIVEHISAEKETNHQSANGFEYDDTNTSVVAFPHNHDASGYAEDMKGPNGNVNKDVSPIQHYTIKRKPDYCRINEDGVIKRAIPNGSDLKSTKTNSLKRLKRKERSSANEPKKRRRNDNGDTSSHMTANCDLQMEMLKIAGQDNQPDSGLSLPSTSSYGDSGMYDLSTMFSEGDCDDETVPKQIASDLASDLHLSAAFHTNKDKGTEGQAVEDVYDNECASDISAQESVSNPCNFEDRIEETSDAFREQGDEVESNTAEKVLTRTSPRNEKNKSEKK